MPDTLVPVNLPPGIFRNGTKHQAMGRWYDANLVRFFDNTIRPIGGWHELTDSDGAGFAALSGVPRAALAWRTDGAGVIQVVGTTQKLMAILGGEMHDITPTVPAFPAVTPHVDTSYGVSIGAYGSGPYGTGAYGVGAQTASLIKADTWQFAPFGNSLACVSTNDRKLRVWSGDPAVVPVVPAGAPASVRGVVATPERFLFALGAGGNSRVVQWPSQETVDVWAPLPTNSAGDFELSTNGELVAGRASRGATLLWTDTDLHSAVYIGGTFVYRFARIGENCGLVAPNAVAMLDGQALWMGRNGFFSYDGYVKPIVCEVQDYVFGDMNYTQAEKFWAVVNAQYGEVWFFYVSAGGTEIDRYVIYNYQENHWSIGKMQRTAGYDAGAVPRPVWFGPDGVIHEHEFEQGKRLTVGRLADGTWIDDGVIIANGEALERNALPYLESGPFELGNGDRTFRLQRIVPDAQSLADIQMLIYSSFDPTSTEDVNGPYSLAQPTPVQILARQIRLRYEEVNQVGWRAGTPKLGIRESSRR